MDSLSQLDAAGLLLGMVICYAILFTKESNKEHTNTIPPGDARLVPSNCKAA